MANLNLEKLQTENINRNSENLDTMSVKEIITLMNEEDKSVISAINQALPQIEELIKACIQTLNNGGRIIYTGAGTSGRLGILDAAECLPTFSTTDEIIAIIAGGDKALVKAVEGAEDSKELAKEGLIALNLNSRDIVITLAASGRTPYSIGSLEYARSIGCKTGSISCNKNSVLSTYADYSIEVDAGPEVLTGSTRLKSGTSQKIILNMISTTTMIGMGKVYKNLMVDMTPTNEKLIERAKRIVMQATECEYSLAQKTLEETDYRIKEAIVMILTGVSKEDAIIKLIDSRGFVSKCL